MLCLIVHGCIWIRRSLCCHRLVSRLSPDKTGRLMFSTVYKTFESELRKIGQDPSAITKTSFGEHLTGLFPSAQRVKSSANESVYIGLKLTPLKALQPRSDNHSLKDITEMFPLTVKVRSINKDRAVCCIDSDSTSNGNKVVKEIIFNKDNTWELNISGKSVNLNTFNIDNTYDLEEESVEVVCTIVTKLTLCIFIFIIVPNATVFVAIEFVSYSFSDVTYM